MAKSGTTASSVLAQAVAQNAPTIQPDLPHIVVDISTKHLIPGLNDTYETNILTADVEECYDQLRASNWARHACPTMTGFDTPGILSVRYPAASLVSWTFFAKQEAGREAADVVATGYVATVKKLAVFYHWVTHYTTQHLILHQHDIWYNPERTASKVIDLMFPQHVVTTTTRQKLIEIAVAASNFTALREEERRKHPDAPFKKYRSGHPAAFITHVPLKTLFLVEDYVRTHLQPELVQAFEQQGYFNYSALIDAVHHDIIT